MPRHSALVAAAAIVAAALVVRAQEQDPLRTHHDRAQSYQLAGDLDRAEVEYRAEVLPRALRRLGNLSGAEGRVDEAIELLGDAARLAPSDVEIQIDLAAAWLRKGELATAGTLAHAAVAAAPSSARARSVSGRIMLLAGAAAEAAEELRRSLLQEGRFETAFALALAHLRLRRLEAARALFDQMVVANATPDLLVLIGRAYLEAGYPALAAEQFKAALARDATTRDAQRYLDRAQRAATTDRAQDAGTDRSVLFDLLPSAGPADDDRRREMRAQLERVLAGAWHNLGAIYSRRGNAEKAAEAARHAARWTDPRSPAMASPIDAESEIRNADSYLRSGDLSAAERAIERVLQQEPAQPAALRVLGLVRAAQERYDEAEALLRTASDRDPAQHAAILTLADVYVARGEFARALAALDGMPSAMREAGLPVRVRAYLGLGRHEEARSLLAGVAEQATADEAAAVADALLARGLAPDAETLLDKVRARGQSNARTLLAAARLRLRQNETAAAEALAQEALSRSPNSVDTLRLLARISSDRGEAAQAFDYLNRARAGAPDAPDLLREFVEAAVGAARPEEALAAARRLVELQPKAPDARHLLGITLLQNQNWREAVEVLSSPPPAAARDARWPLALGLAEFGRRDYGAARASFEQALTLDPGQVEARYHLGLIAREQGRTSEAIDHLAQAIARDSAHGPARLEIGALYLLTGDLGRAQRHLECAAVLNPDDPAPHYQLALLHRRAGDEARARREMQRFQEKRHNPVSAAHRSVIKTSSRKGGC